MYEVWGTRHSRRCTDVPKREHDAPQHLPDTDVGIYKAILRLRGEQCILNGLHEGPGIFMGDGQW